MIATAGVLIAGSGAASENLNTDFEDICKSLREFNTELGASAAPGSPMGGNHAKGAFAVSSPVRRPVVAAQAHSYQKLQQYLLTWSGVTALSP